jgi:hypothetical protein
MRHSPQLTRLIDSLSRHCPESGPRARSAWPFICCRTAAAAQAQLGGSLDCGARKRRALRPLPHVDGGYALPHLRIGGARCNASVRRRVTLRCRRHRTVGQLQGTLLRAHGAFVAARSHRTGGARRARAWARSWPRAAYASSFLPPIRRSRAKRRRISWARSLAPSACARAASRTACRWAVSLSTWMAARLRTRSRAGAPLADGWRKRVWQRATITTSSGSILR